MHAPPQLLLSGISVLHLIFHAYDGTNNASDDPGGEIKYIIVKTREHFHKNRMDYGQCRRITRLEICYSTLEDACKLIKRILLIELIKAVG